MINEERPINSTEFSIYGIIPYDKINGNYSLILKDEEDLNKMVALIIGNPEAQSMAIFLEGTELDRPLTHDLICNILLDRGIDIYWVAIDSSEGDTYFATINFSDGFSIDARPSDAISIAIRLGCPIFINNEIVEQLAFASRSVRGMEQEPDAVDDNTTPVEKKPKKKSKKTLDDLQNELNEAIEKEDYELAAKLRDRINKKI